MEMITIKSESVEHALEAMTKSMRAWNGTCAWQNDVERSMRELETALKQPKRICMCAMYEHCSECQPHLWARVSDLPTKLG